MSTKYLLCIAIIAIGITIIITMSNKTESYRGSRGGRSGFGGSSRSGGFSGRSAPMSGSRGRGTFPSGPRGRGSSILPRGGSSRGRGLPLGPSSRGSGRGSHRGRGHHHHRRPYPYYPGNQPYGYTTGWWPYYWDFPYEYPITTIQEINTYSSPEWCFSKVTSKDINMDDTIPTEKRREEWLKWAKEMGMTFILFDKSSNDFILVQDTKNCFLASNADLSNYEFRTIQY